MKLTITAEQRDALHEHLLIHLSGIGDVWLAVKAKNFPAAERLGREYSDDLRLLLDDLGLGDGGGSPVPLTSPADVLRRVLRRLRDSALSQTANHDRELAEAREIADRNRLVADACASVLEDLDDTAEAPASARDHQ